MVICKNCGAFMRFDPDSQMVKCEYCDTVLDPTEALVGKESKRVVLDDETGDISGPDSEQKDADVSSGEKEKGNDDEYEAVIYTCPQCGGEILWDDDTAATFCSYCGAASVTLEKRLDSVRRPEKIIPFSVSKDKAVKNYKDTLNKALFAPDYMRRDSTVSMFRGIYMPYWCYDVSHEGRMKVKGTRSYRRGDYKHTEFYDIDAQVDALCSGISFDASASFSDSMSSAIAPYNIRNSRNFDEVFLSGFYADRCTVPSRIYEGLATDIAEQDISYQLNKSLGHYTLSLSKATGDGAMADVSQRLCYFPVWFLAVRDKGGSHISYAAVNGQTGKVAVDLPVDFKKYIFGSLLLSLPIILFFNTFLLLDPVIVLGIGVVFAIISLVLLNKQLDQVYTRRMNFDDRGMIYNSMVPVDEDEDRMETIESNMPKASQASPKKQNMLRDKKNDAGSIGVFTGLFIVLYIMFEADLYEELPPVFTVGIVCALVLFCIAFAVFRHFRGKSSETGKRIMNMPFSEKLPIILKPLLAVAAAVIVIILNPVHDYFYYGTAIFSLLMVLLSFFDLIRIHNELCLRKPPQMNRRGGDM